MRESVLVLKEILTKDFGVKEHKVCNLLSNASENTIYIDIDNISHKANKVKM